MMIAFIIPIIVLFFSFLLKSATGPYWQFPDPCYGNLISSLSLVKHLTPGYIASPGTPLQMLGAVVIFLFNIGHSTSETVQRVLLAPEFYLNEMSFFMMFFVFLTSFVLGEYVYRRTNDKLAVLLSQLPVLSFLALRSFSFYDYVPPIITNVTPEPLLVSVCSLFNLCFLKLFFAKKKQDETLMAVLLGVLTGLGIACKLTFFPVLVLPLIVCKRWLKLLYITVSAVSFVFWTIPILPAYTRIWTWVVSLSTHVGEYGSGAQGFVSIPQYILDWHTIFNKCALLILFALVAVLFSLFQLIRNRSSRGITFLLATAFCILLQFGITAKHYDDHYLVSVISLFSPLLVLFYLNVKNENFFFKAAVSLYIILFIIQSLGHALAYNKQLSGYTKDAVSFNNMIHDKYIDFIFIGVFPMPMANPEGAFFQGNDWDNNQSNELASLYPHHFSYFSNNINTFAPYVSGIYSIKERVWADDLITSGARVIFVGPKGYDFSQTPYTVVPLDEGKYAAAYLLTGSTEKQANNFFDAAVQLAGKGDYLHAFAFALKSRELHYQPVEKVDLLLHIIYQSIKHE
jgi:hypothetical protein